MQTNSDSNAIASPICAPPLYPFDVLSDFNGNAIVAEIIDEPGVEASLCLMFPEFDYSNFSHMTIDEVSRKARKEIWGGSVSSDKQFVVALGIGQRAYVRSLNEASDVCLKFITKHAISASQWRGGTVTYAASRDFAADIGFNGEILASEPPLALAQV